MIYHPGDESAIPTVTLQQILDNDRNISKEACLKPSIRNNIALYLKAFHLDAKRLDEQYGFGVDAVRAIQHSNTYQGFVCAVEGKKYQDRPADPSSLDFKIGYETGIKASQRQRRA